MLTFLYVTHFLVCFILIGVVLLQRGKGQDLGASLGGGSANTIFGSRGAGNFLTKITTGSAIIFMMTSLSLSYLGYKASDARLFDESEPFVPEGATVPKADSGLEEVPAGGAAGEAGGAEEAGGLVEIPSADAAAAPEAADSAAPATAPASDSVGGTPDGASSAGPAKEDAAAAAEVPEAGAAGESAPAAVPTPPADDMGAASAPNEEAKQP